MDSLIKTPGLHKIAEKIFLLLDFKSICACTEVQPEWNNIIQHPSFWLKKFKQKGINPKYEREWIRIIDAELNEELMEDVTRILVYMNMIRERLAPTNFDFNLLMIEQIPHPIFASKLIKFTFHEIMWNQTNQILWIDFTDTIHSWKLCIEFTLKITEFYCMPHFFGKNFPSN